jgi:hypothetical protein
MKVMHNLPMAQIIPNSFPYPEDPDRWAELQVFRAFTVLDNSWTVFYSVAWQALHNGRQRDGECDFVLLHPRHGLYAVEVKGGSEIGVVDGQWYTTKRGRRISLRESPFLQAVKSKNMLKDYLADTIPGFRPEQPIGHFVVFPSHTQVGDFTPEARREIICDDNDLANLGKWLPSLLAHWDISANFSPEMLAAIRQRIAPTATLNNSISVRVRNSERALVELTHGQYRAMDQFRRQRRTLVTGGAGTGKTLLAKSRADNLAAAGFQTLLVCFNRPLGDLLSSDNAIDNLTAGSFHSVCMTIAERAKTLPEGDRNQYWWDIELPIAFQVGAEVLGIRYDAIIVDEGQDFHPEWWTSLFDVLSDRDDAIFAVFADSNQNIYRDSWTKPFDVDPIELNVNCRNTIEIAARFAKLAGSTVETLGTHGVVPTVKTANTDTQIAKAIRSSIAMFLDDARISPDDVAILVNRKSDFELAQSVLEELGPSAKRVVVETIQRFKGLEALATVVVLRDFEQNDFEPLVYVALSRARSMLHIVCSEDVRLQLDAITDAGSDNRFK